MPQELRTRDGHYLFADQDDGHVVLYDLRLPPEHRAIWADGFWLGAPLPTAPLPIPAPAAALGLFKITDASDGVFVNRGYAYWSQVWIDEELFAWVFAGHAEGPPNFF